MKPQQSKQPILTLESVACNGHESKRYLLHAATITLFSKGTIALPKNFQSPTNTIHPSPAGQCPALPSSFLHNENEGL